MRSNYKKLGPYIKEVDIRNTENIKENLLGVSTQKVFIKSVANTVGTNFRRYKVVKKNQFTYVPDTSRRGDKIGIALLADYDEALVSQAYTVFKVIDENVLNPEYLMMWFRRPEFDRYARFKSHGSVREIFGWEEMCEVELPVPDIEKQHEIVAEYNTVKNRIALNKQLIKKLEEATHVVFKHFLINDEENESHRLGDLIEIKGGFSYNSKYLGKGESYLLGMGCVSFIDRFVEDGMRLYSDNVPEQHLVNPKDIIVATRQQSENMPILGRPAMVPPNLKGKKMVIASNLYKVVNKSLLSNEIIFQILKSKNYQEHIKLHTKGTTVGMITKDAIEDYHFEAPPIKYLYNVQETVNKIINSIFLKRTENQYLLELEGLLLSNMTKVETQKESLKITNLLYNFFI